MVWLYTLISVLITSLISLVGVLTLSLKKERLKNISLDLVAFATGALFGDAFIHLVPEAFEETAGSLAVSLYILLGILVFFLAEKFLHWHHCRSYSHRYHLKPLAAINLMADGAHNFTDGLLIGATYLISVPLGVATTLAIAFHEIPQEIGDFGILIHAGLSVKKALTFNFFSAVVAVLGAIIALIVGPRIEGFEAALLPITGGGFIYIAGSSLIPELKTEWELRDSLKQALLIGLGIGLMALLTLLE